MNKTHKLNFWYLLAAIIGIFLVQQFIRQAGITEEIPYSQFERLVAEKNVAKVVVTDRHIVGQYKAPHDGKTQFATVRVDPSLIKQAPAIIFIDELDSLGRARSAYGAFGGHDEREPMVEVH
jgi:ATP-dependent Zn protease